MRGELLEVIGLQHAYTWANTPPMQRRGELIRRIIPQELAAATEQLAHSLGPHGEDLQLEGRDGTGRKTLIPWVRFYSEARSPSAQHGWYAFICSMRPARGSTCGWVTGRPGSRKASFGFRSSDGACAT